MPLQYQSIPVSFAQGLDTKTDPKQTIPGKLLELENGVFSNVGAINKRNGYTALSSTIESIGGSIQSAQAIQSYADELLLFSNSVAYSRVSATSKWISRGSVASVILENDAVVRNNATQSNADVAVANGLELYAWEDSSDAAVHYKILDSATRATVVSETSFKEGATPRCCAFGNYLFMFYTSGGTIKYSYVATGAPTVVSFPAALVVDNYAASPVYDVAASLAALWVTYRRSSGGVTSVNLSGAAPPFTQSAPFTIGTDSVSGIGTCCTSRGQLFCVYGSTIALPNWVKCFALNANGTTAVGLTLIGNRSVTACTPVEISQDAQINTVQMFWNQLNGGGINSYIETCTCTIPTGTVSPPSTVKRSVGLVSKAFAYNGAAYVNTVFPSTIQATIFTLDSLGNIVAKINQYTASGLRSNNCLASVANTSSGIYRFANAIATRFLSQNNTVFSQVGVNSSALNFNGANQYLSAQLANNLHTVGGFVATYDGVSFTEHNFHLFPESVQAASNDGGTGNLSAGTYFYSVTYEWPDNYGQIHRSNPSVPVSVVAFANGSTALTIPTLRLTAKQSPRSPVQIVIYRTEANGTVYQRCTSYTSPLLNDPTVDAVQYTDGLSDANLISNEYLYTTGGLLNYAAPPSCQISCTYKNRIFLGGLPNQNQLWYSNLVISGQPVNFSDQLTLQVDARGGDVTALAALDNDLILFKANCIFYVAGEGPNAAGQNSDYNAAQLITTDVGCTNPNSIVSVPGGIMFQTAKGIYMLSHGLQVQYIGAPVEQYNGYTVTSATLVPNTNHVRFTTSGPVLVFDYYFNQWSTFTGLAAVDSDVFGQYFTIVKANGSVLVETPGRFNDGGAGIFLKLTTGWLSFAGIQGYKRVRGFEIVGTYRSTHSLTISTGFDFADNYSETATVDVDGMLKILNYGADSAVWKTNSGVVSFAAGPYGTDGTGAPYGGNPNQEQFRIDLTNQKCESIRISIQEIQPVPNASTTYGEGLSLSALTLTVGVKQGLDKLPANKQFGSS